MLHTVWAVVREGRIELQEQVPMAEGSRVLVTILPPDDDDRFWTEASQSALADVWDNPEDDVYGRLHGSNDFTRAADYVVRKNAELYKRLA